MLEVRLKEIVNPDKYPKVNDAVENGGVVALRKEKIFCRLVLALGNQRLNKLLSTSMTEFQPLL